MSNVNLITFLDAAQRTIIAELVEENTDKLTVKNPVVVNIVPQYNEKTGQPNGQMALQLLPVYFREFQGEKKNPAVFEYPQNTVTKISFEGGFDFRLYGQYEHIFNAQAAAPAGTSEEAPLSATTSAAPVVKLFED